MMDKTFGFREYEKNDIEYIISQHRDLYEREYGFSSEFGDYVEKYVKEFAKSHDKNKEKIWIAEKDGKPVGMIAIVRVDDLSGQLRWFLIEPQARGKGLGHGLMKKALDFAKGKNYKHVFLWTVDELKAARHLYESYGFKLTEKVENNTWTKNTINEERWDLYF